MIGHETLESAYKITCFTANLVVMHACLTAYSRTRLKPLLLLAISAGIAVFAMLFEFGIMRNIRNPNTFDVLLDCTTFLWIADAILYAWGVSGLVSHLLQQKLGQQAEPSDGEKPLN